MLLHVYQCSITCETLIRLLVKHTLVCPHNGTLHNHIKTWDRSLYGTRCPSHIGHCRIVCRKDSTKKKEKCMEMLSVLREMFNIYDMHRCHSKCFANINACYPLNSSLRHLLLGSHVSEWGNGGGGRWRNLPEPTPPAGPGFNPDSRIKPSTSVPLVIHIKL